jgi:hypothetical protein
VGMDRRAEGQARRRMVASEVYASRVQEHLVEGQPREGGRAHRDGQHEPARARGSRARKAEVERAKRDGRWEAAYDSQSRATVPTDLAKALAANPRAARFFETLESHNRYAVLFRIHAAKKPETRAARIEKFVGMLGRHEKLHPSKPQRRGVRT